MSRNKFGDVVYEVWRLGGDVDRIDRDRVEDDLAYGARPDEAAENEVRRHERAQARRLAGILPDDEEQS